MENKVMNISLNMIDLDQIRWVIDQRTIEEMVVSYKAVGQLMPVILVQKACGRYGIVDGKRRILACHRLDLPSVSAIVMANEFTDGQVMQRSLIANLQREDLNPLDEAKAVQALIDGGKSASEVAAMLGKTSAWVTRSVSILALSPDQLRLVEKGKIPASTAYELAQVKDDAERAQLAEGVVEGKLTRDDIANIRKTRHGTRHRTGENRKPRGRRHDARPRKAPTFITLPLGEGCRFIFGGGSSVAAVVELLERLVSRAKAAAETAQSNMDAFAAALQAVPTR